MTQICELTGKSILSGHRVSHANNKTKRRFIPNLHSVSLFSRLLGVSCNLRVSSYGLRQINRVGSIDAYMLTLSDRQARTALSRKAKRIYSVINKASNRRRDENLRDDDHSGE